MVGVRLVDLSLWRFNLENLRFYGVLSLGGVLERFVCGSVALFCGLCVVCAKIGVSLWVWMLIGRTLEEWKVYLINIRDVGEE